MLGQRPPATRFDLVMSLERVCNERPRSAAIVIPALSGGGAERVAAILANALHERGCEVSVITIGPSQGNEYPLGQGVRRIALNLQGESRSLVKAVLRNIQRSIALRRAFRQLNVDVAVGVMTSTSVLTILACMRTRVMAVAAERVHPPMVRIGRLWELARRSLYPVASRVIVQTHATADWFEQNVPGARLTVIPNPISVPLRNITPVVLPESAVPASANVLLAVGRLTSQKGFDRLLSAYSSLARQRPGWVLVILGDGPDRAALEDAVRRLRLETHVRLVGHVGNMDDWYRRASAFVLSSRFEGFPNALLEAMAYGLPVVSMNCPTGPCDIVEHDVNGLLVDESEGVAGLSRAIGAVTESSELRSRLASRAREVALRYSLESVCAQWERCMRDFPPR